MVLLFAASLAAGQEVDNPGELPSLEEIDRQLNNPLSKTWALTFQDNIGIKEGDLVDGTTTGNLLFFQPLLTVPIGLGVTKTVRVGKTPMMLRAEVHYSVIRPDTYGDVWNIRLQVTPVIRSPFIK